MSRKATMQKYSSRVTASLFPIGRRKDYLEIDGSPVSASAGLQIVACGRRGVGRGIRGLVTRTGRGIRCLQPRRSAVKRTRDKGHPRRRSSTVVGVVVRPWGGRRVGRGWDLGCEIEGASLNLFQYLERESKELALRWTPAFPVALFTLTILSFSLSLFPNTFAPSCWSIGLSTSRLYHCFTPFGSVFIVKSFGAKLTMEGHRTSNLYYRDWMFSKSPREFCESNCREERTKTGAEGRYLVDISGGNVSDAIYQRISPFARE